tara:strand:- start:1015 stop:3264 length:2250 start_codon:yes stop_codon:yes gene_type:complete
MKLATSNATPAVHNLSSPSHFSIKKENMSHIIGILRSKIYSNKWLAVLREYLTNAVDAHVEAGLLAYQVELTLPTLSSPTLIIRDFGKGLSEEDVREMYIMYGSSTKRQSNDYTGCLGIGCKAAFAYTDTFTVTSYQNGNRSTYNAVITDGGEGSIYCIDSSDTNDMDGIEIKVPVRTEDIENFKREAFGILPYFDTPPRLINEDMEYPTLDIIDAGTNWRLKKDTSGSHGYHRNHGKATAVMGNIPYKLEVDKMGNTEHSDIIECSNIIINFPLGSLDIAANRESLEYTPRTISNINIEAERVIKDLATKLQVKISNCKNLWDASLKAHEVTKNLPYGIANKVFDAMRFNNERLKRKFRFPCSVTRHYRKHRYRANDYANAKEDTSLIGVDEHSTVCIYDVRELSSVQATMRVRTLQANSNWDKEKVFYAIAYDSKAKLPKGTRILTTDVLPAKFLKKLPKPAVNADGQSLPWESDAHLLKDNYINLNEVETYKPARKKKNDDGSTTPVKIDTCFLKPNHLASGRIVQSEYLAPCNGMHIYIPLDRYSWHDKKYSLEHDDFKLIRTALQMMHRLEGLPKPTIHGVKKHFLDKLDDTWVELDDWYNKLYKKIKNTHRKKIALAANEVLGHGTPYTYSEHKIFEKLPKSLRFPEWETFKLIREQHEYNPGNVNYVTVRDTSDIDTDDEVSHLLHHVWRMFNPDFQSPNTIHEAYETFLKAHPMMRYFNTNWQRNDKEEVNDVKEYLTRGA